MPKSVCIQTLTAVSWVFKCEFVYLYDACVVWGPGYFPTAMLQSCFNNFLLISQGS